MRTRDDIQNELDSATTERTLVRSQRDAITANPRQYALGQIAKIDDHLQGGNGRPPIKNRRATHPGNISMFDHLQALRAAYDDGSRVPLDLDRVRERLTRLDAEITRLNGELNDAR